MAWPNRGPTGKIWERSGSEVVAILLAAGVSTALNAITIAVLYEAIVHPQTAGISENATQILTGWGGGMLGVLGAYVGYAFGKSRNELQAGTTTDGGIAPGNGGPTVPKPPNPPDMPRPPGGKPPSQGGP